MADLAPLFPIDTTAPSIAAALVRSITAGRSALAELEQIKQCMPDY